MSLCVYLVLYLLEARERKVVGSKVVRKVVRKLIIRARFRYYDI